MIDWERLQQEVVRVHRRYAVEVVEALDVCPWAKGARQAGRVRWLVSWDGTADAEAALAWLDTVEHDASADVGLLIFPLLALDRVPFAHFAARIRECDSTRRPVGETVLAGADFHPNAPADTSSAGRLLPFLRRAPDPTLQLARRTALQSVRLSDNQGTSFVDARTVSVEDLLAQSTPEPLAARVARSNLRTVERIGVEKISAIFQDILRDRDESYASCGLAAPRWAEPPVWQRRTTSGTQGSYSGRSRTRGPEPPPVRLSLHSAARGVIGASNVDGQRRQRALKLGVGRRTAEGNVKLLLTLVALAMSA